MTALTGETVRNGVKKLRLLKVDFNQTLPAYEIPRFRGAVIARVGKESTLFHNHDDEKFRYRYPFIQYKVIGKKLSIVCVEDGVEEVFKLFSSPDWDIQIGQKDLNLSIDHIDIKQFNLQVWDHTFNYRIHNWLALNQNNYDAYRKCESLTEKIALLESVLKANILAFAKGIGWHVDKPFKLNITEMQEPRIVVFKNQKMMAFNVDFKSSIFLPNHIGLGKGVSHGFGNIFQNKKNQ